MTNDIDNAVNIVGLDKAEVLQALWNGSHPQGMSWMGVPSAPPTLTTFQSIIEEYNNHAHGLYFDYLMGHVLKVDITGDDFDPRLYDRDCGQGAAARAIASITK